MYYNGSRHYRFRDGNLSLDICDVCQKCRILWTLLRHFSLYCSDKCCVVRCQLWYHSHENTRVHVLYLIITSFCIHCSAYVVCYIKTLRPRQNGRHFADDIFKCITLNENVRISTKVWLTFVSKDPINNIPALVQIIAWRRPGDKPSSKQIRAYMRHSASLS